MRTENDSVDCATLVHYFLMFKTRLSGYREWSFTTRFYSSFYTFFLTWFTFWIFEGTNPEKLRLRLLNSKSNHVLRLSIWYSKPGRLDIYRKGQYVYPTNADLKSSGFTLKKKNPRLPDDQFEPPLTSISGSNYFDNELKMLMVVVRGGNPVDIRTMPIIQVTIGMFYPPGERWGNFVGHLSIFLLDCFDFQELNQCMWMISSRRISLQTLQLCWTSIDPAYVWSRSWTLRDDPENVEPSHKMTQWKLS